MRPTVLTGPWFRSTIFLMLPALLWGLAGCTSPASDQPPLALSRVYATLHKATGTLTRHLAQAAHDVDERDPAGDRTNAALQVLCDTVPQATRCALLDAGRTVLAARPANQRAYAGTVDQAWPGAQAAGETNLICSQVHRAADSYAAVNVGVALPGAAAETAPAVTANLHLGDWLSAQLAPAVSGTPFEVWVMQPDGLILYDANREEIGRNLFADPLYRAYPELLELGKAIAAQANGGGAYTFLRKDMQEPVKKAAYWTTYEFCGMPWRIILAHAVKGRDDGGALVADPGPAAAEDALRTLARDPVLIDALATGDHAWGRTVFRSLFDAYPSIYAVQYVDPTGINQFGYPPENSLDGYDFSTLHSEHDDLFMKAVQREHETDFDIPLIEGPNGHFFLTPVYQGDQFRGMVYLIQTRGH